MVALQEDIATVFHGKDVCWINGICTLSKTHAGIKRGEGKAEDVVTLEVISDVIARIGMGITSYSRRQTIVDARRRAYGGCISHTIEWVWARIVERRLAVVGSV